MIAPQQRVDALAGRARDADHFAAALAQRGFERREPRLAHVLGQQVELVQRDDLDARGERRRRSSRARRGSISQSASGESADALFDERRAGVDEVHQHARALDVTQEAVAEAGALARAFDQAGQIRDDEAPLAARCTTPSAGTSVVNGYAATRGRAAEMRRSSVDLPAFGRPTRPTSAISLSEKRSRRASPLRPALGACRAPGASASRSARCRDRRGRRARRRVAGRARRRSASGGVVVGRVGVAHDGADRHAQHAVGAVLARAIVAAAVRRRPRRAPAVRRLEVEQRREAAIGEQHDVAAVTAVAAVGTAARIELARGGSATQPSPPRPAATSITASSMKCFAGFHEAGSRPSRPTRRSSGASVGSGLDARRHAALRGAVGDGAVDEREERVVAAEADVAARVHARADLAHEDGAGVHGLARVALHAAALAVAVATVARAALTLFVRHDSMPAARSDRFASTLTGSACIPGGGRSCGDSACGAWP